MFAKYHKIALIAWLLAIVSVSIGTIHHVWQGHATLDTSILSLLPRSADTRDVDGAFDTIANALGQRIPFVIQAPQRDDALAAAARLETTLRTSNQFATIHGRIDNRAQTSFFDTYFPARWQVLTSDVVDAVNRDAIPEVVDDALAQIYSPITPLPADVLYRDPFLLFPRWVAHAPTFGADVSLEDDYLVAAAPDGIRILITAHLREQALGGRRAKHIVAAIDQAVSEAAGDGVTITWTGFVKYAAKAEQSATRDVSVIGLGSLLGILLLVLTSFRSPRVLVFLLLPIFCGMLAGYWGCRVVFGTVHVITLAFGASLVGVCVDYGFHYAAHHLMHADNRTGRFAVLQTIFPGILMGMLTSAAGYGVLLLTPFPGLSQMALFALLGLIAAFVTVVLCFPWLPLSNTPPSKKPLLWRLANRYMNGWLFSSRRGLWVVGIMGLGAAVGMASITTDDDIRLLRGTFPTLEQEEAAIQQFAAGPDQSRFILIEGFHEERLVQREETVLSRLHKARQQGSLTDYFGLATLVPSQSRQHANRTVSLSLLNHPSSQRLFDTLEISAHQVHHLRQEINRTPPLVYSHLRGRPFFDTYTALRPEEDLWSSATQSKQYSVVMLKGIQDPNALTNLVSDLPFAHYMDKVGRVSDVFKGFREQVAFWLVMAYAAIGLLLAIRYGARNAVGIMFPPVLTAALLLGGMGLLNIPINLFTLLGILLILAIGIDYTLFFTESKKDDRATGFAIALSACTTILSLGLLGLSNTPALTHLGGTMSAGIVLAMLLSPFCRQFNGHWGHRKEIR